jgi:hypothetical protein
MEGTAMTASKPVRKSDWKDGFLFLGNHLALDFLNTSPVQNGEGVELLTDFDALLRWFQAWLVLVRRPVFGNSGENQPDPSVSWKPCGNCAKG